MVITRPVCWGKPERGLMLGVSVDGTVAELHLKNTGATPLEVMSHVLTSEFHLDWYTLHLEYDEGRIRKVRLLDERDSSGPVKVHLEPEEGIQHSVDLADWVIRPINGAEPMKAGTYRLYAVYEVSPPEDAWTGRLEAGPVAMTI